MAAVVLLRRFCAAEPPARPDARPTPAGVASDPKQGVRMGRGRARLRAVGQLGAACVARGSLVAAMLAPVGVGVGVLSNQVNDAVGTIAAGTDDGQLTRAQVPLTTTVLDRTGAPIATLYDQYRLPVTYDGIAQDDGRRDHRHRGPAVLHRGGRRPPRGAAGGGEQHLRRQHPGRVDDHPAVRQELPHQRDRPHEPRRAAGRPGRHDLPQGPRGGAGAAAGPQRAEGADPRRATSTSSSSPAASTAWPRPRTPTSAPRPTSSPCRRPRCWPGW